MGIRFPQATGVNAQKDGTPMLSDGIGEDLSNLLFTFTLIVNDSCRIVKNHCPMDRYATPKPKSACFPTSKWDDESLVTIYGEPARSLYLG
jgi:hypothetical protein